MKSHMTHLFLALTALCALAACKKDGSSKGTPTKEPAIDSTTVAIALTAGVWALQKVEYPQTSRTWATAYDSFSSTLTLHGDRTLAFASANVVINAGTWKLSRDAKLLTLTYAGQTDVDTLGMLNSTTLQLTVPRQISVYGNFYGYYRDTYILEK